MWLSLASLPRLPCSHLAEAVVVEVAHLAAVLLRTGALEAAVQLGTVAAVLADVEVALRDIVLAAMSRPAWRGRSAKVILQARSAGIRTGRLARAGSEGSGQVRVGLPGRTKLSQMGQDK